MNATLAPPVRIPLRKRLAELMNATAEGLWAGMHDKCRTDHASRCPACAQSVGDTEVIDAGIASVTRAATEAAAIGAYFDCHAAVAGLGVAVESVAVDCGTGGVR